MKTKVLWSTIFIMVSSPLVAKKLHVKDIINLSENTKETSIKARKLFDKPTFDWKNKYIKTKKKLLQKTKIRNLLEEPSIKADFALGHTYRKEYLASMNNTIDWDSRPKKSKVIKGFSRHYFTTNNGGKIRLLNKLYDSDTYLEENCFWYIDNVCVNLGAPNSELYFNKDAGAYKIEAKRNDTTLLSFTAVFLDKPEIVFRPNSSFDGEYGFDDNRFEKIALLNGAEYLDKKSKYLIPFMSLIKGQTATIEAQIMYDRESYLRKSMVNTDVVFVSSEHLTIAKQNETNAFSKKIKYTFSEFVNGKVVLNVRSDKIEKDAFIEAKIGKEVVGKIKVEVNTCLKPSNLLLVKVVVNDRLGTAIDINKEKNKIENLLNKKSFNQAFTQWDIAITDVLELQINKSKIKLFDIFKKATNHYQKYKLKPLKTVVMFIAESDMDWDANGYGNYTKKDKHRYTIINTKALDKKTLIHELGHSHGLVDMVSKFKSYFYDTNGFMDYYSIHNKDERKIFWKYQWEQIYNLIKEKQY